jgi:hypothetical protein
MPSLRALRVPAVLLALLLAVLIPAAPAGASGTLWVSPSGSDANPGTSASKPLATIQKAVDKAGTGGTVNLAPGHYRQDVVTRRPGLTLTGPAGAIVQGAGSPRVIQVRHDDVTLRGFTVDGLAGPRDDEDSYRDKLVYVMSTTPGNGVSRLRIEGMTITNSGGECVRLRYLVRDASLSGNTIGPCGAYDFRFDGGGKNGEGIYLGTAPEQQGKNEAPDHRPDVSRDNHIFDNKIETRGAECVDIKEDSTANLVEGNLCTGSRDRDGGGLDARGNGNTFRGNLSTGHLGAGIRLGGDDPGDGMDNVVVDNELTGNQGGGVKFEAERQGLVCGNTLSGNGIGKASGSYAEKFDPGAPCPPEAEAAPGTTAGSSGAAARELSVVAVTASGDDGNKPANAVDGNLGTRWSDKGSAWLRLELEEPGTVTGLRIAFYKAAQRSARFSVDASPDGTTWKQVFEGASDPASPQPEQIDLAPAPAPTRFVRINGSGNGDNQWTSVSEVRVLGAAVRPPAPAEPAGGRDWRAPIVLGLVGLLLVAVMLIRNRRGARRGRGPGGPDDLGPGDPPRPGPRGVERTPDPEEPEPAGPARLRRR